MITATNSASLTAAKALNSAQSAYALASERIATTKKINRSSDDPAGQMLATNLKTYIGSFSKVSDNLNTTIAAMQSVDTGLTAISSLLSTMLETATLANVTTLTSAQYTAYTSAFASYQSQIDTVAKEVTLNGSYLMYNTTAATTPTVTVQYGINSGDSMTLSSANASTYGLSLTSTYSFTSSGTGASDAVTAVTSAISTLSGYQTTVGSNVTVMSTHQSFVTGVSTNYQEAYNNVVSADIAAESTNLAAAKIRTDAASAMLAQGNAMSEEVVAYLLKGKISN